MLYGSSALNGIINIRTARPGLTPKTRFSAYVGVYGDAENDEYQWSDKSFWKDDKYSVKPILRGSLLSGIRNPIYEGFDLSHSRRIGNFDVSGGINLFTDEGYRQQGYNKRFRMGGSLTYHQPDMGMKLLNYGFNVDFLSINMVTSLSGVHQRKCTNRLLSPTWDVKRIISISIRSSTM